MKIRAILLTLCACSFGRGADHVALLGTYTDTGSRGIYAVRLNSDTGELSSPALVAELTSPEFLALHPNGQVVFAATQKKDADGKNLAEIEAFAADPSTGALEPINAQTAGRGTFAHLAIDASGHTIVAASYGGGFVASFPVDQDGHVGACATVIKHSGPLGPTSARQEAPHAHSVSMSPDSRFAYVADLGLDRVFIYRIDDAKGAIAPNDPGFASVAPGAGPRHTKFSPDGKNFYALDELNNTVTCFRYDASSGVIESFQTVSTLPDGFAGKSTSSEIRVHPNGRFVYTANRGDNSIAIFKRDRESGRLSRIGTVPSGGEVPRNFSLSPDGNWLLCANQTSNNLTVFRVDPETGRLTRTSASATVSKAVCVLFLQ